MVVGIRKTPLFLWVSLFFITHLTWAQRFVVQDPPKIQISTDPARVRNGEPVLFKLRIETKFEDKVEEVVFPPSDSWKVINVYKDPSTLSSFVRGKRILKKVIEYSYTLLPLKKGLVTIPVLPIVVNNKEYKSYSTLITVDKIRDSLSQTPQPQVRNPRLPNMRPFTSPFPKRAQPPPESDFEDQLIDIPELDSHFVRAIPSKTTVFEGEMLQLSYRVFQRRQSRLENSTIAKFPDFKGFLKEELFIARQYTPKATTIRGESFLEFELIRYALFPLKSGLLTIDPLRFRATTFPSLADLEEDLLFGTNKFSQNGIPMEKSSQAIKVNVRPLPPTPSKSNFSGAVGVFNLELAGPTSAVYAGTPFTMSLTISGEGNVKSIEEPILTLPEDVELKQTQNRYEFDVNASGSKTFEYILVSKVPGLKKIPELNWTFFNPYKEKYQTVISSPIEFTVLQGSPSQKTKSLLANDQDSAAAPSWTPSTVEFGKPISIQEFQSDHGISIFLKQFGWKALFLLYTGFFASVIYLSRKNKMKLSLAETPWIKTEYKFKKSLKGNQVPESIRLIDLWMRQRLVKSLENVLPEKLTEESERELFYKALEKKLSPEMHFQVRNLQAQFRALDLVRFANGQPPPKSEIEGLFQTSRELVDRIVSPATTQHL